MTDDTTTNDGPDPDPDHGGRPRRVSDDALLRAVQEAIHDQPAPVASTSDIEDRVSLSRRGLQKRLRALRERGAIGAKDVGTSLVWWVPSKSPADGQPQPHAAVAAESDPVPDPSPSTDESRPDHEHGHDHDADRDADADRDPDDPMVAAAQHAPKEADSRDTAGDADSVSQDGVDTERAGDAALEAQIQGLNLPGRANSREGRAAVRACYELLVERGRARAGEFKDAVYPEHDAGYGSAGGWWNAIGKGGPDDPDGEGLRDLAEQRADLEPPAGGGDWFYRYIGDDTERDATQE